MKTRTCDCECCEQGGARQEVALGSLPPEHCSGRAPQARRVWGHPEQQTREAREPEGRRTRPGLAAAERGTRARLPRVLCGRSVRLGFDACSVESLSGGDVARSFPLVGPSYVGLTMPSRILASIRRASLRPGGQAGPQPSHVMITTLPRQSLKCSVHPARLPGRLI